MPSARRGALVIVGTGIHFNHVTSEARFSIQNADRVLHVVTDHITQRYIESLNPNSRSLNDLYEDGKPRKETYRQMVDAIMEQVRAGFKVCAAFYGHPGVFVFPSHDAIRLARSEGYEARMLPGISSEDCLFADLGIDPGSNGCQSFEATDFLVHRRKFDPSSSLVLWQIGVLGLLETAAEECPSRHLDVLAGVLRKSYGGEHEVVVYEASPFPYPMSTPSVQRTTVDGLMDAKVTQMSTLYIPPVRSEVDREMMRKLGLGMDES